MYNSVEEVLNSNKQGTPSVTVSMDGLTHTSDDFVAILAKDNGDAAIFYNTDAMTLGMAMKMVSKAFVEAMSNLPEDERNSISEILSGNFDDSQED